MANLVIDPDVPAGLDPATGVISKDITYDHVYENQARLYLPPGYENTTQKLPVLVYYHGGGFLKAIGINAFSKSIHRFLNAVVSKAKVVAVSLNYRLAEEARLPAAYDDSLTGLEWVFAKSHPWLARNGDFNHVFLAGDSAGANIAHNIAMTAAAKNVKIEGVALLSAYFWGVERIGVENEFKNQGQVAAVNLAWLRVMGPEMKSFDDRRINPLADVASLARLACERVFVVVGEEDMLSSRQKAYIDALNKSNRPGKPPVLKAYKGQGHCFWVVNPESKDSKDMVNKLAAFFNSAA